MALDYPDTRRDDTVDRLHGHDVPDPYRWLEDPDSAETRAWVLAQNEVSRGYLDALPSREWFQLGVVDTEAFDRTVAAGVRMVMDTCPAIEWPRLSRSA